MIESSRYAAEIERLQADPRIRNMAVELAGALHRGEIRWTTLGHDADSPSFELMSNASDRYRSLGGTEAESIGGPARAVLGLIDTYLQILEQMEA